MSDEKPREEKPARESASSGGVDPLAGLEQLGRIGREVGGPARKLAGDLIQRSLAPGGNLLDQTRRTAETMGQIAGQIAPKEVTDAIGQVGAIADQVRRDAVDPAMGLADLVGDCLDGLDVLVSTSAVALPIELDQVRLALARSRRPLLKLDLALPAETSTPLVASRLVRTLVAGSPDLREQPRDLDALEIGLAEAVRGAVERTRRFDPRKPIEIRTRLQADLLIVEVVDGGPGESAAAPAHQSPPAWDVKLVRGVMDEVSYEPAAQGGTLHLKRTLRSWRLRRAG